MAITAKVHGLDLRVGGLLTSEDAAKLVEVALELGLDVRAKVEPQASPRRPTRAVNVRIDPGPFADDDEDAVDLLVLTAQLLALSATIGPRSFDDAADTVVKAARKFLDDRAGSTSEQA